MRFQAFSRVVLIAALAAPAFAQSLTDYGAVTAGSTAGGASGKAVSNGITAIFGKVEQQSAKPAAVTVTREKPAAAAALKVGRGAALPETGDVPPPPTPTFRRVSEPSLPIAQMTVPYQATQLLSLADVTPALPPPSEMSAEKFHSVTNGMTRDEVLKFGEPASKLTMFEDGHLVEMYSYHQNGHSLGTLRLTDGTVSSVR